MFNIIRDINFYKHESLTIIPKVSIARFMDSDWCQIRFDFLRMALIIFLYKSKFNPGYLFRKRQKKINIFN